MVAPGRPALATARQSFKAGLTWTAQRLSTFSRPSLGVGKRESHPAHILRGRFDGLAHEPRRHGVQLVCVVFPGRSGGPGGVLNPFCGFIGTTVGLMNVVPTARLDGRKRGRSAQQPRSNSAR
jgi:hypothetical protein